MAAESTQNVKNHRKFAPLLHFVVLPILAVNALRSIVIAVTRPGGDTLLAALVSVTLIVVAELARSFALRVQDRVIRLEMRLRLRELLPPDLVPRISELAPRQLIALRFASDRELPALTRRVLDERLQDAKAIKQMITDWQADHLRA
jgi:hypothetical protein